MRDEEGTKEGQEEGQVNQSKRILSGGALLNPAPRSCFCAIAAGCPLAAAGVSRTASDLPSEV